MKNNILILVLLINCILWACVLFSIISIECVFYLLSILSCLLFCFILFVYDNLKNIHKLFLTISIFEIMLLLCNLFSDYIFFNENKNFNVYLGKYQFKKEGNSRTNGNSYYFYYLYKDNSDNNQEMQIDVDKTIYNSKRFDTLEDVLISKFAIFKANICKNVVQKYKYPITIKSQFTELGNNSYEYAKYEPFTAYENFGLNIVYKTHKADAKYIYFKDINGCEQKIENYSICDTFLVYSNINPKFFDGWHVCNQQETTPEALSKVPEDGYGYIFRGKIYSKYETEQYWNIIDQYKQGMRE